MVGIVVTISPSLSLYRMVVLPAASRPTMRILICFLANSRPNRELIVSPILTTSQSKNGFINILDLFFLINLKSRPKIPKLSTNIVFVLAKGSGRSYTDVDVHELQCHKG